MLIFYYFFLNQVICLQKIRTNGLKTKKARCSFAPRRFPVYNLMKSFKIWYQDASFVIRSLPYLRLMIQKCSAIDGVKSTKN